MVVLNGLLLLVGIPMSQEANHQVPLYDTLIQVFFQVGAFATTIGVVTTAQGAIVCEKQLGTAAWSLSKLVSRSAFVLAKFVAYAMGFVSLAIVLPSAIFYGQSLLLAGRPPELAIYLAGVGLTVIHTLFYLALTLLLGTLFSTRCPPSGRFPPSRPSSGRRCSWAWRCGGLAARSSRRQCLAITTSG
jgi:ABC-2 type transport system permease protein